MFPKEETTQRKWEMREYIALEDHSLNVMMENPKFKRKGDMESKPLVRGYTLSTTV